MLSSEVGVKKPDPQIFRLALDRIGSTPVTTAFIGNDWTTDVLGAQRVGLRDIYLNVSEGVRVAVDRPGIIEVAPTLEAIGSALRLRLYAWQAGDA